MMILPHLRTLVGAAALLATTETPLMSQERTHRYTLDGQASHVWFTANSTGGAFKGETRTLTGAVEIADTATLRDATGHINIDASTFRTGNGLRDKHLRGEMQVNEYPRVSWVLDSVTRTMVPASDDTRSATLHGRLTVKATTHNVDIPARYTIRADSLHVTGELPITFTQYGWSKPPTKFFGLAKVADDLMLHFDAVFLPEQH
jgi:polyisoprenoid-binding protein YceI